MGQYWQEIILILGLILLNAFFAAGEIAVLSSKPVRIRQLAEGGTASALSLLRLTKDHSRFLATMQVGITLAGFMASAAAAVGISDNLGDLIARTGIARSTAQSLAIVSVTVVVAYVTLVIGELAPKRLALQSPERIALLIARPVEALSRLTGPFTSLLTASTNLIVRLLGGDPTRAQQGITEAELRIYVEEHTDLEDEEKQLIAGVFDFGDRLVRHVMVPRPDMDCLSYDTPIRKALQQVRNAGYSNFPVFQDNYDNIVGMVSLRDLLYHLIDSESDGARVLEVKKPAAFVPDTKRAIELLKEMQREHFQMAIVVDEHGGVAGLVTLRDLLGEIADEVGDDEASLQVKSEHLLDATETLDDVEHLLGISLPQGPYYQTLAGYVMHALGEIPQEGDYTEVGCWRLTVEKMDGRRVDVIRATADAKADARQT